MKRRNALKYLGAGTGAMLFGQKMGSAKNRPSVRGKKRVARIAHITDVHIRPEHNAPDRFLQCLQKIKNHKVDFFLNGGDTIYAADYAHIKRERVHEQWDIWQNLREEFSEYEVCSCLGNHDMWWAAEEKSDHMYGKNYAIKQLGMPQRYYHVERMGWHVIVLDSNNLNAGSLDEVQMKWLQNELQGLPAEAPVLIMTHYPILGVSTILDGGNHTDSKLLTQLFYQHRDKKIHCISGHVHLQDASIYNQVHYYCNGAVSGFWWEDGNQDSAQTYWYHQTPPGYAIIDLYKDGSMSNRYYAHNF